MSTIAIGADRGPLSPTQAARKDVLTGVIALSAIIMFIGTGSQVLHSAIESLYSAGGGSDRVAGIALVLNIALILFAWRRYKDVQVEMAERAVIEEQARFLASRDPLTHFLNRGAMASEGEELIAKVKAEGKLVAMVSLDLDRFQHVNEVYGHAIGDRLLRALADEIRALMPADAICARHGGDEFSIVVPFAQGDEESVDYFAEQLLDRLQQPFDLEGVQLHAYGSVGVSKLGRDCSDLTGLVRQSDIAMNHAKKARRNKPLWFDTAMESELLARNEIEAGLRRGLPLGEFMPYYQPQMDLASGELRGFEMLARWRHPTGGIVGPDVFIPVAEETNLIGDLSQCVMRQAFTEAKSWDPSLSLSVNISPRQLRDPWLAQRILKLLAETGFPPERLEIEITETSLFDNLSLAQSIITSLKNQGVRLSLDDFGTGFSSLAHLRALPFDRIKIDHSFVVAMNDDQESRTIVHAVTKLGENLGILVTAEGIEDQATEDQLRAIGCDNGQGFFYGRPMAASDVRELVAKFQLLSTAGTRPTATTRVPLRDVSKPRDAEEGERKAG
jgi:diguanylate cyclase (GGDEF)-like protein